MERAKTRKSGLGEPFRVPCPASKEMTGPGSVQVPKSWVSYAFLKFRAQNHPSSFLISHAGSSAQSPKKVVSHEILSPSMQTHMAQAYDSHLDPPPTSGQEAAV